MNSGLFCLLVMHFSILVYDLMIIFCNVKQSLTCLRSFPGSILQLLGLASFGYHFTGELGDFLKVESQYFLFISVVSSVSM